MIFADKLCKLHQKIKHDAPERPTYVQLALQWSKQDPGHKVGHPDLHRGFAVNLWQGMSICCV